MWVLKSMQDCIQDCLAHEFEIYHVSDFKWQWLLAETIPFCISGHNIRTPTNLQAGLAGDADLTILYLTFYHSNFFARPRAIHPCAHPRLVKLHLPSCKPTCGYTPSTLMQTFYQSLHQWYKYDSFESHDLTWPTWPSWALWPFSAWLVACSVRRG